MSDYKDDVFNTAISQIYVNGQYLFITNFMDTTLIGSIEDGEIKKMPQRYIYIRLQDL